MYLHVVGVSKHGTSKRGLRWYNGCGHHHNVLQSLQLPSSFWWSVPVLRSMLVLWLPEKEQTQHFVGFKPTFGMAPSSHIAVGHHCWVRWVSYNFGVLWQESPFCREMKDQYVKHKWIQSLSRNLQLPTGMKLKYFQAHPYHYQSFQNTKKNKWSFSRKVLLNSKLTFHALESTLCLRDSRRESRFFDVRELLLIGSSVSWEFAQDSAMF